MFCSLIQILICIAEERRHVLQGLQHFEPYQHSGHMFTKTDREECILGSLRTYFKMDFQPVSLRWYLEADYAASVPMQYAQMAAALHNEIQRMDSHFLLCMLLGILLCCCMA